MTERQREAAMRAVVTVAGYCDGARELDGCGFNKLDTDFGKSLARKIELVFAGKVKGLTLNEMRCVVKLALKYRRQADDVTHNLLDSVKIS